MPADNRNFKGINYVSRVSRWRAVIYKNNKQLHLGYYPGPVAAAKAYDKAALLMGRDPATLNFPPESKS